MASDVILTWTDYADERRSRFTLPPSAMRSYRAYLTYLYTNEHGEPPPEVVGPLQLTEVFVNVGRWIWLCQVCGGAVPVEPEEPVICYQCGTGGWKLPKFPINRDSIEEELLRQPGRRVFAPLRNWKPGWTVAYLQGRTEKANAAIAMGNPFPRSLSIGATRAWAGGEVLTASNKNTFESAVMDDLAGRNGRTDQEDAMRIKDGTDATVQPYLDLTQDYVGLPLRTSDPGSSAGRITYRSDLDQFRINRNGLWSSLTFFADLISAGVDIMPGTEVLETLPAGDTFGSYRWMQAVLGANDEGVSDTLLIPVSEIPSGPFDRVMYLVAGAPNPSLYTVNINTGIATIVGSGLGTGEAGGLASHGGILYLVDSISDSLYTVNVNTGIATIVGSGLGTGITAPRGLASHGGILYLVNSSISDSLHTVNINTGIATIVGSGLGTDITAPAGLASHGGILYLVDRSTGTDGTLATVNVATGIATDFPNALGISPRGLVSHGGILYTVSTGRLYTVNVNTGIATTLGGSPLGTGEAGGLASHGAAEGFNVNPWLLIRRNSNTQISILPLQIGHLHGLLGIT